MSSRSCQDVEHCLSGLLKTLQVSSILSRNLQLVYGRAAAREFEACLRAKEQGDATPKDCQK